jgi:hypothetical protein
MSNSKPKLALASSREPFGKVTSLEQIPSVLFELLWLSREIADPKGKQIAGLVDDVITVALADPEAWLKIEQMAENGSWAAFSRLESEVL